MDKQSWRPSPRVEFDMILVGLYGLRTWCIRSTDKDDVFGSSSNVVESGVSADSTVSISSNQKRVGV